VSPAKHYHHTIQHHHQRNQALETWQRCTYSPIPLGSGELPTLQIRVQSCTKQHALLAPYSIPNAIATTKKQIDQKLPRPTVGLFNRKLPPLSLFSSRFYECFASKVWSQCGVHMLRGEDTHTPQRTVSTYC
jgi:hypothetical protein